MKEASRRWLEPLLTGGVAIVAIVGIVALQQLQLTRPSRWAENPQQAEQQEAVRLGLLKTAPTFGFDNLIADWTFLSFLQYFGDDPAREKTGYGLSPDYFDVITRLDPRFVDAYLFLSGSISYQLGKPADAIKLMDRGTQALSPQMNPKAFLVWRFKGLDQLLLLGDVPGSIYSHEMAANWVEQTPDRELAPAYRRLAAFLKQDPNSAPIRLQAWISVYYQATLVNDKQTQERVKREIAALGGEVRIDDQGRPFVAPRSQPSPTPKPSPSPQPSPSNSKP